jgi:hypothetical protein
MINECTDCKHCASFAGAYRIYCSHPNLKVDAVYEYMPLGDIDAEDCPEFDGGMCYDFTWNDLMAAEKYSEINYDDENFGIGLREWIDIHKGEYK